MSDSSELPWTPFVALTALQVGLAVGPHIGYFFQYREIARSHSSAGYAPLVSLILLTSYSLRLLYFIGEMYQLALFFQAMLGIFMHGALLLKVLSLQRRTRRHAGLRGHANGFFDPVTSSQAHAEEPSKPMGPLQRPASELPREDNAGVNVTSTTGNGSSLPQMMPRLRTPPRLASQLPNLTTNVTAPSSVSGAHGSVVPSQRARVALDATDGPAASLARPTTMASTDEDDDNDTTAVMSEVSANGLNRFFLFRWEDALERGLLQYSPLHFFATYVIVCVVSLAFVLTYYAVVLQRWRHGAALVGYIALGIEATLVVPQILRNARRRSTAGLTYILVFTWVAGDASKIVYFILAKQPLPFTLCGILQLGLDFVVVWQLVHYYGNSYTRAAESAATVLVPPATTIAVHEEEEASAVHNNNNSTGVAPVVEGV